MNEQKKRTHVALTGKGLAFCDFAFRDGPQLGLSEVEAYATAKRLIELWDGSETLLQMYTRAECWPDEVINYEKSES